MIPQTAGADKLCGSIWVRECGHLRRPSGPIPSNLLVTLNTGLIGQPTLGGQTVTAVGPMIDTGSAALAEAGTGLGQAIQFTGAANVSPSAENADLIADSESAGPKPDANDPGVVAASLAMLAQKDPVARSALRG